MRKTGRLAAFVLVLAVVGAALVVAARFLSQSPTSGDSAVSLTLPGLGSPGKALLGVYLDARADALAEPAGLEDDPVVFVIGSGESVTSIAARLERSGLITDSELFRRFLQYHDLDSGIEAGQFILRQTMTIPQIADALQEGHRPELSLTIREGLRLEEIAVEVATQTGIPVEEFRGLVTSGWRQLDLGYAYLQDLPEDATLEGYLWPETYLLPDAALAEDVLVRMLDVFDREVSTELRAAASASGLNVHELLTLASIIEREAVLDSERAYISGVYHNRLNDGWQLGADPTVQYGLGHDGDWWPMLYVDDLALDLEYSTYVHIGLPPGPICSPGLESIRAAAMPAATGYYFFLVDCEKDDGSHLFAATEGEHFANYSRCGGGQQ